MNPRLTLAACLGGIVLFGFVVSKPNGTKSQSFRIYSDALQVFHLPD